jgi:predicted DNA binding CopG/RHH family protein
MKKTEKYDIYAPLDKYEEDLIEALEHGKLVQVPNQKEEIAKAIAAAKYTLEKRKKDKRITVRVDTSDLATIQNKALESGIPYQTLIASILRKFAQGKIQIGV